jgi:hypothetical protein
MHDPLALLQSAIAGNLTKNKAEDQGAVLLAAYHATAAADADNRAEMETLAEIICDACEAVGLNRYYFYRDMNGLRL